MTNILVKLVIPFTFSVEGEYHIRLSGRTCIVKIKHVKNNEGIERYHPAQREIPMTCEYLRNNGGRIPKHRLPTTGFSDHFPIFGTIEALP